MELKKRKKLKIILISSIVAFSIATIALSVMQINYLSNLYVPYQTTEIELSNDNEVDPIEFWENEIDRINISLNAEFGKNYTLEYTNPSTEKDYEFTAQEVVFDSANWVDEIPSAITLHGYILYPEKVNYVSSGNPGILCMHGLGGNANASFGLAYQYLEEGFIALCHDHPGHGESEGAPPTPQNFFYDKKFNESAHFYLTICGAFQGLKLLQSLDLVDNDSIMVTGGSYGALNTMWLSSIVGDQIAGAVPYVAVGDLKHTLEDPNKLLFWVWDKSAEELKEKEKDFWDKEVRMFDPIYYLESPKVPPILWQVGTNDEFFSYQSINGTYDAVPHKQKFLQIFPDGHHGFPGYEDTTKYFVDYVLNGGSAPPNISTDFKKVNLLSGEGLEIEVEIESDEDIESVQVCYKYLDIMGSCWEKLDLSEAKGDKWEGVLNPGIITSMVDFYIIVNLKGNDDVWFSSKIFTPGILISNFTIPFYILVVALIAIPAAYLIWRRYKKNVRELDPEIQSKAKKYFILELSFLAITESLFYISIFLPFAVFEGGDVVFSHIYVFNNLFTWRLLFGDLAPYMTLMFLTGWIIYSLISIMKPMLSGFLKFGYPLFVIAIIGTLTGLFTGATRGPFGLAYPGIGVYLMLFCSLVLFPIGYWKRRYQTKLGIREAKTKLYNIDRWLRIKPISRIEQKSENKIEIEK